jgi:hypothetical protein
MIATGAAGCPSGSVTLGAGTKIIAVKLVETRARDSRFAGGGLGGELPGAIIRQQMPDKRGRQALNQLSFGMFFTAAKLTEDGGFFAWERIPPGASRAAWVAARPAAYPASGGAQVASPQRPILR